MKDFETKLELYEEQISFCECMSDFNPDCLEVFQGKDRKVFAKYFFPDWSSVKNFQEYYKRLIKEDPQIERQANRLLEKFLIIYRVEEKSRLLPEGWGKK